MARFGQTGVRGGDPRITSSTTIAEIQRFCESDIASGSPNTYACGQYAINSSKEVAARLCQQGVREGCRIANIPEITPQQSAEMAARREEQANRDRDLIAKNLEDTCDIFRNPAACFRIAQAIRNKQDVVYAQDLDDAKNQLESAGADSSIIDAAIEEFEARQPWYTRILETYRPWYMRKIIWISVAISLGLVYYYIG